MMWWQVRCNEDSSKFGCDVNIKSMLEEKCVGSLISCCNPDWEVMTSILEPILELVNSLQFVSNS